jgi:hypothetical protein
MSTFEKVLDVICGIAFTVVLCSFAVAFATFAAALLAYAIQGAMKGFS